ncbi:MAG: BON domain-containing protein [Gammaproteobacteria bacterium]|nr:BON domain-containing protein [Gammaproteobacteria bacterium]
MAQRQSRERFDPYDQYGAGNDEQWGGRGRRDDEREAWGGGRMRGEGWRGGERGGEYEPGRSYDANASRYRGGYGGQNEQWSDDYQSDWRRRNMDEDRYRGGYSGGTQEYGRAGGMGGLGRGEYSGQGGFGGAQQGWGRERDWAGGHGSENWNRGQQSGYGGGQTWNRSGYGGGGYGGQQGGGGYGSQNYGGSYPSGDRESFGQGGGYGAWQDPYGHPAYGGSRNPYAYGSGYGGGSTDSSWGRGEESGMGGIRGSLGSAQRGQGRQSFHGVGPQGYERSDDKLKEMVCERLTEDSEIDPSQVHVEVSRGEVTLTGQVRDRETKFRIEDLVDKCGGVKEIHNNVRVQSGTGQSGQQHGTQRAMQSGESGQLGGSTSGAGRSAEKSPDQSKQQR